MAEDERLTVAQLSGLIKWTEELRDQGLTLQGVIDRMVEWRAEEAGNMEGPPRLSPLAYVRREETGPMSRAEHLVALREHFARRFAILDPTQRCILASCALRFDHEGPCDTGPGPIL